MLVAILSTVTCQPLYVAVLHQFAAPCHADIEVCDLLTQRIPCLLYTSDAADEHRDVWVEVGGGG